MRETGHASMAGPGLAATVGRVKVSTFASQDASAREPLRSGRPMLEASHVHLAYGAVPVLRDVTLAVMTGELVALVGESGAGKTTLLRCFNRLALPHAGTVTVAGADVRQLDAISLRRRLGYVPQEGGLMPHWDVGRNAALVPRLQGETAAREHGLAALRRVGLAPEIFAGRRPSTLSGGQRQRVAIARALAARPDVLLMDEPFGALDAITREELHAMFAQLRRSWRVTTLLVTHDLREAASLADRIAVMHHGRLEQIGEPAVLRRAPATSYVRKLIGRFDLGADV